MARKPLIAVRYTDRLTNPADSISIRDQRHAVARFARDHGFEVVAEYTDVRSESVSRPTPPRIMAAINDARRLGCPIAMRAFLDLPQDLNGYPLMLWAGVPIIMVDPVLGADVAPVELRPWAAGRDVISARTREGLAAARERGVRLGAPDPSVGAQAGARAASAAADRFAAEVLPSIREVQERGETSLRGIARALDARGVPTARGGKWTGAQVAAVLARVEAPEEEEGGEG